MASTLAAQLRRAYAQSLMTEALVCQYNETHDGHVHALPDADKREYAIKPLQPATKHPANTLPDSKVSDDRPLQKICIVGAGAAGLHTALALQYCKSLNLQIDILESSDRPGGRMYTHEFKNGGQTDHNYVDVGAMRIPEIERMKTTFNLIENELKMGHVLQDYTYTFDPDTTQPREPSCWWYGDEGPEDEKFGVVMKALLENLGILKDFDAGHKKFNKDNLDKHSTRSWLMSSNPGPNFNYEETVLAEGATTSTGLFDQALMETVCDYLDFHPDVVNELGLGVAATDIKKPKIGWKRVEGGMKVIVDAMVKKVKKHTRTNITYECPVVAYKYNSGSKTITVTTQRKSTGKHEMQDYDAVFNTTALPCLQRMDISGLGLEKTVLTGIRTLAYDRATKVAIKFSRPWWRDYLTIPGGVSSSDLPISNTVYPSWTFREDGPESAVLIASYSWAQDATRMGALFENSSPHGTRKQDDPDYDPRDEPVVTLCLENLAMLWSKSAMKDPPTFDQLRDMYEDHFAYAWSHDEHQGGAYAMFAPGQFGSIYPAFFGNHCDGRFIMCGEALSVQHAWIAGAIDSSYNSVQTWLCRHKFETARSELKESPLGGGQGNHPLEFSERLSFWSAKLGCGVDEHEGLGHTERHDEKNDNINVQILEVPPLA